MGGKFCSECGAALSGGRKFCSECGKPVLAKTSVRSAAPGGDRETRTRVRLRPLVLAGAAVLLLAAAAAVAVYALGLRTTVSSVAGTWTATWSGLGGGQEVLILDGSGSYSRKTPMGLTTGSYEVSAGLIVLTPRNDDAGVSMPALALRPVGPDLIALVVQGQGSPIGDGYRFARTSANTQTEPAGQTASGIELVLSKKNGAMSDSEFEAIEHTLRVRAATLGFDIHSLSALPPSAIRLTLTHTLGGGAIEAVTWRGRLLVGLPAGQLDEANLDSGRVVNLAESTAIVLNERIQSMRPDDSHRPPDMMLTLDDAGKSEWVTLTSGAVGKRVALTADGSVLSAPLINEPIRDGRMWFDAHTWDDPRVLAILASGALPYDLILSDPRAVGLE
jgi:hypothetical protein